MDPISAVVHITGHVLIRLGTAVLGDDTPDTVPAPATVQHTHIHHHHYETTSTPPTHKRWGKS